MNTEKIITRLIEAGCPEKSANRVAAELETIDSSLHDALNNWLDNEVETDMTIGDFTLSELKQKHEMSYPAALLTMDWLIKEPKVASEAIKKGVK